MQDIFTLISQLNRPKLLVQAARVGLADYNRATRLPRLLDQHQLPRSGEAAMSLLSLEAEQERLREAGTGEYSAARHIEILIALMTEAALLRSTRPQLVETT